MVSGAIKTARQTVEQSDRQSDSNMAWEGWEGVMMGESAFMSTGMFGEGISLIHKC